MQALEYIFGILSRRERAWASGKDWCKHFTENLEGDLIRIVELNLKGGTRIGTSLDYVPIFKEIDPIKLDRAHP